MNYENQAWLDNWLRLKAKAESKNFNNLAAVKEKVRTIAFIQQKYTGKVIIEDYPDLTQLNLSNNELEEIVIRNCPDLKLVSVGHNKLIKLKIENCPSIQEIYTHNNKLTKWEVDVEDLKSKNLRTISYSDNPLNSEEKTRLDALGLKDTTLKSRVNGDAQTWLDHKYPLDIRDSIEKLDISELGLQGVLNLEGFTNLKMLDCSNNELIDLNLSDCKKLEYLDCSNNQYVKNLKKTKWISSDGSEKIKTTVIKGGITNLDVSKNEELQEIHANNSFVNTINLVGLTKIHTLMLTSNDIKALNLTDLLNLEYLNCALNKLKGLDVSKNSKLKALYCYDNSVFGSIEELNVSHLKDLEYLYCYDNSLTEIDCSDLSKLRELYCQGQSQLSRNIGGVKKVIGGLKSGVNLQGCISLQQLDLSENRIEKLNVNSLPSLLTISCKVNGSLTEINANNCPCLSFLDYSLAFNVNSLNLNGTNNLKELYYSKGVIAPDWKTLPSLEKIGVGERRLVKDEDGNDYYCYFVEETNVLAQRNAEKVENILANPNNYSANDLIKISEGSLSGISIELRKKLAKTAIEKLTKEYKEKFADEVYGSDKEEEIPLEEPTEEKETPQENDDKKVILSLQEQIAELKKKIAKLEANKENIPPAEFQEKITSLKTELASLVNQEKEVKDNDKQSFNYPLGIGLGTVVIILVLIGYFLKISGNKNKLRNKLQ